MALHSSDNHTLGTSPFGTVMTEGYSLDLGLDQFGIFSKAARKTTKKGLKVISSFENGPVSCGLYRLSKIIKCMNVSFEEFFNHPNFKNLE